MDYLTKLGQKFVIGFEGTSLPSEIKETIKKYKFGNVILFSRNVESIRQLKLLCREIHDFIKEQTGFPPFIMIDQEGGMVSRLSDDFLNIPGAMALSATGNEEYVYKCGRIIAKQLINSGVNFDLAPVLDINSNIDNPVIGVRSYGEDDCWVSKYSANMIRALEDGNVISCAKHFPGHGDTAIDSHLGLPVVNKSKEELYESELRPFINAIKEGIPAIMTTHILFPELDSSNLPATLNKTILTGLLRNELGFEGLIITDCLEMGAIKKEYGTAASVKTAFEAGADLACISHTVSEAVSGISMILKTGFDEKILDESFSRITEYKKRYLNEEENNEPLFTDEDVRFVNEVGRKTITEYGGKRIKLGCKPLFISSYPFVLTLVSNPLDKSVNFASRMAKAFGGDEIISSINPTRDEIENILKAVEGHTSIVFGSYNAHMMKGQLDLINALDKTKLPLSVVALRNPYDLREIPSSVYSLATYEYSKRAIDNLIEYWKNDEYNKNARPFLIDRK